MAVEQASPSAAEPGGADHGYARGPSGGLRPRRCARRGGRSPSPSSSSARRTPRPSSARSGRREAVPTARGRAVPREQAPIAREPRGRAGRALRRRSAGRWPARRVVAHARRALVGARAAGARRADASRRRRPRPPRRVEVACSARAAATRRLSGRRRARGRRPGEELLASGELAPSRERRLTKLPKRDVRGTSRQPTRTVRGARRPRRRRARHACCSGATAAR